MDAFVPIESFPSQNFSSARSHFCRPRDPTSSYVQPNTKILILIEFLLTDWTYLEQKVRSWGRIFEWIPLLDMNWILHRRTLLGQRRQYLHIHRVAYCIDWQSRRTFATWHRPIGNLKIFRRTCEHLELISNSSDRLRTSQRRPCYSRSVNLAISSHPEPLRCRTIRPASVRFVDGMQ